MNKTISMIFVFLAAVLVSMSLAAACSCIPPKSVSEEVTFNDLVFRGKVIDVREKGLVEQTNYVIFDVQTAWKGNIGKEIKIETARDSAGCGYNFEEGKEYIVYAHEYEGTMTVSLCSRTALVEDAQEDLNELKNFTSTTPQLPIAEEPSFWERIAGWFKRLFTTD